MKYITTIDKEFEIEVVDERHIRIGERLLKLILNRERTACLLFDP